MTLMTSQKFGKNMKIQWHEWHHEITAHYPHEIRDAVVSIRSTKSGATVKKTDGTFDHFVFVNGHWTKKGNRKCRSLKW